MASGPLNLRSPREIRLMSKAGGLVWEAHQLVRKMIRPGITTGEIDAEVEELFRRHAAVPLFQGVAGKVPFPAVTCMSINDEVVHGIPGPRVLQAGDVLSVDTGCKVNGWCGDSAWTYRVGQVDTTADKLLEVTEAALELAIELLNSCEYWSEVARHMQQLVETTGFSVVTDFVGHGIGREMHEAPEVPNYYSEEFRREGDFELRTGLVLAIEPMVNAGGREVNRLPDHWTQATVDGSWSAHFEHTVALTSAGPRILTGPPED
jgi:methionyl aminopeptidase